MKILVVGGAGYIGAHTVNRLIHRGHEVIVLDDFSSGREECVPDIKLIRGNFGNAALLDKIFKAFQFECVIHFAAFTRVDESVKDPGKYYRNNLQHTLILLNKLVAYKIKNFIFSSSAAIYGNPSHTLPIDEDHPKNPINPYGCTKWMIEQILNDYQKAYGLQAISLRYFNASGCDQDARFGDFRDPETHLIPLILQAANGRRPEISIYGQNYPTPDGTCIRDYVHVVDIADAHLLVIEKLSDQKPISQAYNLGSGKGYSVKEVINTAERITEKNISVSIKPFREGDTPQLIADITKAHKELGWCPQYSNLDTILSSAWRFELKHFGNL